MMYDVFFRRACLRLSAALMLFLLAAAPAYAQSGTVTGRVLNARTDAPLARANVVLAGEGLERGTSTDAEGRYRIADLPAGTYELTASIVGFETVMRRVTLETGQTKHIDLRLTPARYGLSEVVVSATRSEAALGTVPSSVSVLDAAAIDRQSALTGDLGAILAQTVPGLAPSTGTLSNYGQTLRGRAPLILIDGVPQSTPLRDASRDLHTISPSAVARIEVVRGASALYGYGATGGAINIVTARPRAGAFNATTTVGTRFSPAALSDSFTGRLMQRVSGRTGRLDYLVSGSYESWGYFFDAAGDRIPPDPQSQGGLANADEAGLLAKAGAQLAPAQRLDLSLSYYDFKQTLEYTAVPGVVGEKKTTTDAEAAIPGEDPGTENWVARLRYAHEDLAGSRLAATAYVQDYTTRFGHFPNFGQTVLTSEKLGARLDVETPLPLTPGATLLWGLDLLRDETAQPFVDGATYVPPITQTSAAPFAQIKLPVGRRLVLRGGARYEAIRLSVDDFTTRGGSDVAGGTLGYDALVFNAGGVVFLTEAVDLFGSFAQGFSVADVGRELRATEAASVEQLQPEAQTVNSYELGLRLSTPRASASVAGFINTSDLGSTFGDLPELAIIRSPERVRGIEATLDLRPTERLKLGGTFAYLEGKRDANDDGDYETYLPGDRIPPLKLTGYVAYAPTGGWQNRLQVLHSGTRDRFEGEAASQFGRGRVEAYTTVDLFSAFDLGPGTLQVGIENLLDAFYFPTVSQWYNLNTAYAAAPGRRVSLTYTLRW